MLTVSADTVVDYPTGKSLDLGGKGVGTGSTFAGFSYPTDTSFSVYLVEGSACLLFFFSSYLTFVSSSLISSKIGV